MFRSDAALIWFEEPWNMNNNYPCLLPSCKQMVVQNRVKPVISYFQYYCLVSFSLCMEVLF